MKQKGVGFLNLTLYKDQQPFYQDYNNSPNSSLNGLLPTHYNRWSPPMQRGLINAPLFHLSMKEEGNAQCKPLELVILWWIICYCNTLYYRSETLHVAVDPFPKRVKCTPISFIHERRGR